jgi:hypothetical protein
LKTLTITRLNALRARQPKNQRQWSKNYVR